MNRSYVWLCVFAVGCGSGAAAVSRPTISGPKVTEFKTATATFLHDVKSVATELERSPTADDAQKLADKVKDSYARLPDVPLPLSDNRELVANLKELPKAAAWNAVVTKTEEDSIQAGTQLSDRNSPKAAIVLRDLCNKIEQAIDLKQ